MGGSAESALFWIAFSSLVFVIVIDPAVSAES
jgi:hypothetical protein